MSIPYPQHHQPRTSLPYVQSEQTAPTATAQPKTPKLSREEAAKLALEHTVISTQAAWTISVLFLLTIFSVPLIQYLAAGRRNFPIRYNGQTTLQHIPTAGELKGFEDKLSSDSVVARWILPRAQWALLQLGAGNEQVMVGRDHWLMYRPDVEYLTGRGFLDPSRLRVRARAGSEETAAIQPNPLPAILRFKEQLAQRGISLIVMPVPLKPMLYPEQLSARYAPPYDLPQHPLQNPSYAKFTQTLQSHGVLVCDVTKSLLQARQSTGQAQFLETDAHWTPTGMQVAAQELSRFMHDQVALPATQPLGYQRKAQTIASRGDIAGMLKLPVQAQNFQQQAVTIQQVSTSQGGAWKPSHDADVLLLGDSFINIYSRPDLGWGESAGLAEQLSYELHRPLDVIAVNAGGAAGARQRLREDLLQGNDRLAGKRVVVWEFAMRDLMSGDWQMLDLPGSSPAPTMASALIAPVKAPSIKLTPSSPAAVAKFRHDIGTQAVRDEKINSNVFPGKDGWLFYLPDIYYLTMSGFLHGPQPPQIKSLVDFKRQLARRGIKLLVMPVPPKTMIYPEQLGVNYNGLVPQNPAFARFRHALEAQGISCFDATSTLLVAKSQSATPVYIPTDTHWSWAGMDSVAQQLAGVIARDVKLPQRQVVAYARQPAQVRNVTDISMMLKPIGNKKPYVYNSITVQQVKTPDGKLWQPAHDADVLVLGDSLTNIYSYGGYWGKAAGLTPQLSYYLQRPVDSIAIDGGGADMPREELQQQMLRGEDRLAGKKLVICEFACRYLIGHPWKIIHFPAVKAVKPVPGASAAVKPQAALLKGVAVRGKLKARAVVPPPNTMPYKDLVMAAQLTDVEITSGPQKGTRLNHDILVYVWGMRDRTLTPAATWNPGQSVIAQLTPWRDAEDQYGSYNRVGLDSREALKMDAYWGGGKPG